MACFKAAVTRGFDAVWGLRLAVRFSFSGYAAIARGTATALPRWAGGTNAESTTASPRVLGLDPFRAAYAYFSTCGSSLSVKAAVMRTVPSGRCGGSPSSRDLRSYRAVSIAEMAWPPTL